MNSNRFFATSCLVLFRMPACGRAFSPVLATMMVVCLSAPLSAQYNQQRGAVVGGLTGAAAGAIIGENSDEPGVGAAIGGIVGALAGKVLGNVQDQQAYQYQAARQQQVVYQQSRTMSVQDVVAMAQSRVGDTIIASEVQNRGLQRPLEIADIVFLSQQGVSDQVIRTMQQATVGGPAPPPVLPAPRAVVAPPVIVTRPAPVIIHGPPRYAPSYGPSYGYGRPPRGHHHYHQGRRSGVNASIHFR